MDMMGSGMMGHGMGHAAVGAVDGWHCASAAGEAVDREISADDVRAHLKQSLKRHRNARLKVGEVTETDDDTIVADTVDDWLVRRMEIDSHTGSMRSIQQPMSRPARAAPPPPNNRMCESCGTHPSSWLTWPSFSLALAESFAYGWYVAPVFGPPYNVFVARLG